MPAKKTGSSKVGKKEQRPKKDKVVQEPSPKELSFPDLLNAIYEGYGPSANDKAKAMANDAMTRYLQQSIAEISQLDNYNIIVIFDPTIMVKSDADAIYSAVTAFKESKPVLLILYSKGGEIGSAYLIGQLCREYCNGRFVVAVPRMAKSSATLLCCAADEIHMGSLSELGPIDPQISGLPALGLRNSIQHIAQLVKENPESSEMFAKYLHYSLKPIDLGYYERVAESAVQYAERLLNTHQKSLPRKASLIANELVYTYKDHGFVIDKLEAQKILGDKIVKHDTDVYALGNTVYKTLNLLRGFAEYLGYDFYFIGSLQSEPNLRKRT